MITEKVMKGVAAAVIAASTMGAAVMPVLAEEDTKSTTAVYEVTEGYEWTIHDEVDFGQDKGVNATSTVDKSAGISVTKNVIGDGKALSIKLADANDYQVHNGDTALGYTVSKDAGATTLAAKAEVLKVNAGTNTGTQALQFKLSTTTGASEVAGDYSGTIGYTASIVAQ